MTEQELWSCLRAEEVNGFGFRSTQGHLYFAWIFSATKDDVEYSEIETTLKDLLENRYPNSSLLVEEWLGRLSLRIHFSEWEAIPGICKFILSDTRFALRLRNRWDIILTYEDRNIEFTWTALEGMGIAAFHERYEKFRTAQQDDVATNHVVLTMVLDLMGRGAMLSCWNYCTPQGKEFCRSLRQRLGKKDISKRLADNRFTWHDGRCPRLYLAHGIYFGAEWSRYLPSRLSVEDIYEWDRLLSSNGNDRMREEPGAIDNPIVVESMDPPAEATPIAESVEESLLSERFNTAEDSMCMICSRVPAITHCGCMYVCQTCYACITNAQENNRTGSESEQPVDDLECMICMDAPASTIVEPCGHICVCQQCSAKLQSSNDAALCVRCRTPIKKIINVY